MEGIEPLFGGFGGARECVEVRLNDYHFITKQFNAYPNSVILIKSLKTNIFIRF
jgi:hypothetical protein